jgi:soluble lytic murein transglycosylase-like protein
MKFLPVLSIFLFSNCIQETPSIETKPVLEVESIEDKQRREIGNYTILMMQIVNTKLSKTAQNIIAKSIVNVAMEIFSNQEERKQFVVLIGIESKFNPTARSSAGAVGLTQVIPKYAKEFGAHCGMNDVTQEDLLNPDINLFIGACWFKVLLNKLNSNVALALVAYNAGQSSSQLKQLKSLNNITNIETSSYVAKYTFLRSKADNKGVKHEDKDIFDKL